MRTAHAAARLFLLVLLTIVLVFIVAVIFPLVSERTRIRLIKRWAPRVLWVLGIRMIVRGQVPDPEAAEGLRAEGPGYLVCANHISFADIFVLDTVLPVRFIAKKEIASWPVFGLISRRVGTIFIDRSSRRAIVDVAADMDKHLQAGENVLFFPEGTTGPGDALLPFYANLFSAAKPSNAELLPIAVRYLCDGKPSAMPSYAHRALFDVLWDILRARDVAAEVTVLSPIPTEGRDRRVLCAEASRVMADALGWPDATAEKARALEARRAARGEASA